MAQSITREAQYQIKKNEAQLLPSLNHRCLSLNKSQNSQFNTHNPNPFSLLSLSAVSPHSHRHRRRLSPDYELDLSAATQHRRPKPALDQWQPVSLHTWAQRGSTAVAVRHSVRRGCRLCSSAALRWNRGGVLGIPVAPVSSAVAARLRPRRFPTRWNSRYCPG